MLNPRQYKLYDLLKLGYEYSTRDVMHYISEYGIYKNDKDDNTNSTLIRTDLLKVNESDEVTKILVYRIVDGNYYFSCASKYEEANNFAESVYREKAIKALVRYSAILQKCRMNGQGVIISKHLDPITEKSKAERFIESYVKGGNEEKQEIVEEKPSAERFKQPNLWGC